MIEFEAKLREMNIASGSVNQRPVVCVEAGHIYMDEAPTLSHEVGAMVGAKVSVLLDAMGLNVQKLLFVDDYNSMSDDLDLASYQDLLSSHGFTPELTVMESTLVQEAEEIVGILQDQGLTEENRNGAVVLRKSHKREKDIVLRKSPSKGLMSGCVALDTALYLRKIQDADLCVTVLHKEWKDQQAGVKKVLKALGREIPILEVYYNDEGDIEVDFEY